MSQPIAEKHIRAGAFETIVEAEGVIRQLLAAGFSKDQLVVICPAKFLRHLRPNAPHALAPSADPEQAIAMGGAVGATIGGLAWVVTFLSGALTAGAAAVLIGGGAIAGGISNLIVSKGYESELNDYYKMAVEKGWIVVGIEIIPGDGDSHIEDCERILAEAGANVLEPV